MAGWGKVASWAQARQSAVIAEFAKRRPPELVGEDEGSVYRYATEEIACALSLTVRGADNRLGLAQRLDESLPATREAWERYRPPKALTDFVRVRDRVCQFPPCRKSADRCDLDHRQPFSAGGNTSADNLQPLCPRHHELKHDHRWAVHRKPDGTTEWTAPTGHTYVNQPER